MGQTARSIHHSSSLQSIGRTEIEQDVDERVSRAFLSFFFFFIFLIYIQERHTDELESASIHFATRINPAARYIARFRNDEITESDRVLSIRDTPPPTRLNYNF